MDKSISGAVSTHPAAALAAIGVLVLLVLVLGYYAEKYRTSVSSSSSAATKSTFCNSRPPYGNNSMWYVGGQDAGNGGSVDRMPNKYNATSHLQNGSGSAWTGARNWDGGVMMEHLATSPSAGGSIIGGGGTVAPASGPHAIVNPCGKGQVWKSYIQPDTGAVTSYCEDANTPNIGGNSCRKPWNADAVAEAEGLASAGSYQDEVGPAEMRFQSVVNSTLDKPDLSDDHLNALMHTGGIY